MSEYFRKQRRYGGGGHIWTTVCSGIVLMTYIKYKERHERVTVKVDDEDSEGNRIFSKDAYPESLSGAMWAGTELRNFCREHGRAVSFGLCGLIMSAWFVRAHGAFNRLMINRYGDIHYQIRRPDMIQGKLTAIRYLALPGLAVPVLGAGLLYSLRTSHTDRAAILDQEFDARARAIVASITGEGHNVFDDKIVELHESPLAQFARNSRQITAGFLK
eukprot:GEMP01075631.1.p1 GENE.GEMP01075631.1~~GEMP01075631.1.p1  ORF type:complete len:217 (-),score=22.98 GEMP01075631.1:481-1131(-)